MKAVLTIFAALTLASCAPTMHGANAAGGMLEFGNRHSTEEALRMAEAHCQQFGKHARPTSRDADFTYSITFECVSA
jgi:hypothetical protein